MDGVAEAQAGYHSDVDYEHEHRFAEHEQDSEAEQPMRNVACASSNEPETEE